MEETFTMTPRPSRSKKCGSTACEPFIAPSRLSSRRRDWDSSGTSSKRPHMLVPALLTHTSIPPKADTAASANSRTWSGSVTSVGTASARAPSSSHPCTARSSSSRRLAASTTLAPRAAKARAVASPMPLEAPVITTVASPRLSMILAPLFDPQPTNRQVRSALLLARARCKSRMHNSGHFSHRRSFGAWHARRVGNPKMARTCARRRPLFAQWNGYRRFGAVPAPEEGWGGRPQGREGGCMGINRWSGGIEDRKRNETDAKAGDELPEAKKGDASSRVEASEGPAEDPEKREVLEKLRKREREP